MTITIRQTRRGTSVIRMTGSHARTFASLLAEQMGSESGADAPDPVPERSESEVRAHGAEAAAEGS